MQHSLFQRAWTPACRTYTDKGRGESTEVGTLHTGTAPVWRRGHRGDGAWAESCTWLPTYYNRHHCIFGQWEGDLQLFVYWHGGGTCSLLPSGKDPREGAEGWTDGRTDIHKVSTTHPVNDRKYSPETKQMNLVVSEGGFAAQPSLHRLILHKHWSESSFLRESLAKYHLSALKWHCWEKDTDT